MSQIARWLETRSCFALLKSKEQRAFAFASLVFGRFRISKSLLVELAAPQDKNKIIVNYRDRGFDFPFGANSEMGGGAAINPYIPHTTTSLSALSHLFPDENATRGDQTDQGGLTFDGPTIRLRASSTPPPNIKHAIRQWVLCYRVTTPPIAQLPHSSNGYSRLLSPVRQLLMTLASHSAPRALGTLPAARSSSTWYRPLRSM